MGKKPRLPVSEFNLKIEIEIDYDAPDSAQTSKCVNQSIHNHVWLTCQSIHSLFPEYARIHPNTSGLSSINNGYGYCCI